VAPPRIFISCLHYSWVMLEEAFARCADEFRLDGIELSLQPYGRFPHIGPQYFDEVAELAARYHLALSGHIWDELPHLGVDEGARRLVDWLEATRTMGIAYLVVHGGSHDDQAEGVRAMAGIAATAAPRFEAAGVVLCIENHYAYHYRDRHEILSTSEEFLELFRLVDSPAVRFCLDYGHAHLQENTEDLLRRVGPYLAYAHLADNLGDDDHHLPFGHGTIDWRTVLLATREAGFGGPFTIEFPVRSGRGRSFRKCIKMLRKTFR